MKYIDADKVYEHLEQVGELYPRYADNIVDNAVTNVINDIKNFISSLLQEQPSEDLEKAAKEYEEGLGYYECMNQWPSVAFKAGAQWQKEQMEERWLKDREGCFWDGVEEGKKVMKEQMMKGAVDTDVKGYLGGDGVYVSADLPQSINVDEGDKVKVIIVKGDKK